MEYYRTMFVMVQDHKYDADWLESLYPFERDIYLAMLSAWIKEEQELARQ